jgi:hypothetical protein
MYTINELKQIQLQRQHLTDKADKQTVCHDLNGLQAQFMVNVEYSLRIRCNEKIEKDNFFDGLVKNWTVRNTVHVFNQEDLPIYVYQDDEHPHLGHDWTIGRIHSDLGECKIDPQRLESIARLIVDKVSEGITTREDLKQACYQSGVSEAEGAFVFSQWGGLLRPLCERGFLCYKVQEKKEFMICNQYVPMEKDSALLEQATRYFTHFAPATIKDTAYYFGWSQAYTKEMMSKLPLSSIQVDGKDYYYLGSLKEDYPDIPKCIFLAGFDQIMLGYQKAESIYLPQQHLRGIFNLAGIVMPSILLNGSVVGKWKKDKSKLILTIFEEVTQKDKQDIIQMAESMWDDIKKLNGNRLRSRTVFRDAPCLQRSPFTRHCEAKGVIENLDSCFVDINDFAEVSILPFDSLVV